MIRVVVFDVGGVLVELTGVATFRSWLGNRLTAEEIWRRWLASPAVRDFETGRVSPDVFADELIDEFVLPVNRDELLAAFAAWPRRIFPGAGDLIRRVNRVESKGMHRRRSHECSEVSRVFRSLAHEWRRRRVATQ